jgi:hypothetical protein
MAVKFTVSPALIITLEGRISKRMGCASVLTDAKAMTKLKAKK